MSCLFCLAVRWAGGQHEVLQVSHRCAKVWAAGTACDALVWQEPWAVSPWGLCGRLRFTLGALAHFTFHKDNIHSWVSPSTLGPRTFHPYKPPTTACRRRRKWTKYLINHTKTVVHFFTSSAAIPSLQLSVGSLPPPSNAVNSAAWHHLGWSTQLEAACI